MIEVPIHSVVVQFPGGLLLASALCALLLILKPLKSISWTLTFLLFLSAFSMWYSISSGEAQLRALDTTFLPPSATSLLTRHQFLSNTLQYGLYTLSAFVALFSTFGVLSLRSSDRTVFFMMGCLRVGVFLGILCAFYYHTQITFTGLSLVHNHGAGVALQNKTACELETNEEPDEPSQKVPLFEF